jgi:hypothetical protein
MVRTLLVAMAVCALNAAWAEGEREEPKAKPDAQAGELEANAANAKIKEILTTRKVSFDFVETPAADALSFLKATLGVNLVVAPGVDLKQRLTLKVNEMNAGEALRWLARVAGAQVAVKNGAVVVSAMGKDDAAAGAGGEDNPANRRIAEVLKTKRVSFDFVETPFQDAMSFMQALLNVNVVVAPELRQGHILTLKVTDMEAGKALQWMARLVGAKLDIRDGAVCVWKEPGEPGAPRRAEGAREPRPHRMIGKAQFSLGAAASVELYLYEDDLPPELRGAIVNALQKALAAELEKAAKREGGGKN